MRLPRPGYSLTCRESGASRRHVRFDPPPVEMPNSLRWVLLRALGPVGSPAPTTDDGARTLDLARRSGLASLIGSRHALRALATEVGARAAAGFALEYEAARRAAGTLLSSLPVVAELARAAGTPVVLLKFAALTVAGYTPPGTRTAGDVDVLVDPETAEEIADGLLARGFAHAGFRGSAYQLPLLLGASGRKVELHRYVPGVQVAGATHGATVKPLQDAGLLENVPADEASGSTEWRVPTRELLVAHAIVHGVAQHGFKPQGYPLFRMVADLVALGAASADPAGVHRWIGRDVSEEETRAALTLAGRLAEGDARIFDASAAASPDGVLLRHLSACLVDNEYVSSLRLRWPGSSLGRRGPLSLGRAAWEAVALTDAQIDVIYGPPRSRWGYAARRFARPFDLVGRSARYARADSGCSSGAREASGAVRPRGARPESTPCGRRARDERGARRETWPRSRVTAAVARAGRRGGGAGRESGSRGSRRKASPWASSTSAARGVQGGAAFPSPISPQKPVDRSSGGSRATATSSSETTGPGARPESVDLPAPDDPKKTCPAPSRTIPAAWSGSAPREGSRAASATRSVTSTAALVSSRPEEAAAQRLAGRGPRHSGGASRGERRPRPPRRPGPSSG